MSSTGLRVTYSPYARPYLPLIGRSGTDLSNPLRIVLALLEAGELCICDIAAAVDVSETSAS